MLERRLQEDPETPQLGVEVGEVALLEELGEVGLGEVAGLVGVISLVPDEGVEGVPVGLAQVLEGLASLTRRRVARRQHLGAAGRRPPHGSLR